MNFNYEIKCTPPYGEGIFTRVAIPAGTCVWFYKLNVNVLEFDENQSIAHLTNLKSLAEQQRFLDLTFGKQNVLCLITDDGQYMNSLEGGVDHSELSFTFKTNPEATHGPRPRPSA